MREKKKSIPVIKFLIVFSIIVFISGLIYVSYFKQENTTALRKPTTPSKMKKKTADTLLKK